MLYPKIRREKVTTYVPYWPISGAICLKVNGHTFRESNNASFIFISLPKSE